jgi:KaiC/GvpD/RAD55 family RecA-like ATPase
MLDLDYTRHEGSIRRGIRVTKMRGSAHSTDEMSFEIKQGGLRVQDARVPRYIDGVWRSISALMVLYEPDGTRPDRQCTRNNRR